MDRYFVRTATGAAAVAVAAFCLMSACVGSGASRPAGTEGTSTPVSASPAPVLLESVAPVFGAKFAQGERVPIRYTLSKGMTADSVVLSVGNRRIGPVAPEGFTYNLGPKYPVGRVVYRLTAYRGGESQSRSGEFTVLAASAPALYGHRVKRIYPHDRTAYTQGLLFHDGSLYESTGLEGQSTLRQVELSGGRVLRSRNLSDLYFGEGLALLDGKLYQLTWQNNKALVYDLNTFDKTGEFDYGGEGWGLATDGEVLYMSDGTEKIRVLDPATFRPLRTIEVYTDRNKVMYVNEMEWVRGELWANVYTSDNVIRIDPQSGAVLGVIDLGGLLSPADIDATTDVLNGIAFDPATGRIFVTGKNWNKLFEIEVVKR